MFRKIIVCCNIIFFICCFYIISFADEISDDELLTEDMSSFIETSSSYESEINLNSRIAVAYDRDSKRMIWGKEENKRTAMASTTKIMTATVVLEQANLNDVVEVSKKSAGTGGSRLGLKTGDKITVNDLLYGLMLKSGNDAAVALAEHVGGSVENFANMMNEKANNLLLKDTHFVTPHGLDDPNHYTTAMELAKMADYALNNSKFLEIVGTKNYNVKINNSYKNINNTNELLGNFSGIYGVKTGFTNNAGRCLVTAVKSNDMDFITVVIQADTKKDRTKDSIKIINYVMNDYKRINIEEVVNKRFDEWSQNNKEKITVDRAKKYNLELYKEQVQNKNIVIKSDSIEDINIEINAIYDYEAPVKKGKKMGEIKIFLKDELLEVDSIYFSEEIARKDFLDYLYECTMSIFFV